MALDGGVFCWTAWEMRWKYSEGRFANWLATLSFLDLSVLKFFLFHNICTSLLYSTSSSAHLYLVACFCRSTASPTTNCIPIWIFYMKNSLEYFYVFIYSSYKHTCIDGSSWNLSFFTLVPSQVMWFRALQTCTEI